MHGHSRARIMARRNPSPASSSINYRLIAVELLPISNPARLFNVGGLPVQGLRAATVDINTVRLTNFEGPGLNITLAARSASLDRALLTRRGLVSFRKTYNVLRKWRGARYDAPSNIFAQMMVCGLCLSRGVGSVCN